MQQAFLIAVVIAAVASIRCRGERPGSAACPPAITIEALHAATYWLEQDAEPETRERLAAVLQALHAGPPARTPLWRFAHRLQQILRSRDLGDTNWRLKTERLRMDLHDWQCTPDELHAQLHTRLEEHRQPLPFD